MGHEFTGTVYQVGSFVKAFSPGDKVVSPFISSCGECFYCTNGFSSRCASGMLFVSSLLEGAQAEYVRVLMADSTCFKAPNTIDSVELCLMADIFRTGYFAAYNALAKVTPEVASSSVVVLLGCGPVGLCVLIAAMEYKPRAILVIDSIEERLKTASELGAEPWNFLDN